MEEYEELTARGLNAKMEDCHKRLYAYSERKLEGIGQIKVEISAGDKRIGSHLVVTKSGRCLLGHETSQALGLLRISSSVSSEFVECNVVGENLAPFLQAKYPTVFVGVGKLKDYKLKLYVDSKVTPLAQKPRRVPFALRAKVTAKFEDLIAKDIMERVNGPTSWVSPVVIAPKASGDIRLCVDMRKANAAIIRERIPIPTVDEVLENLNGGAVFSKLVLCLGFHQIELDEDSRDITTFATHDGLFRYKRLSFGVNSAPEKYQQIIRQVVSDIGGVQNIADDLIVHGKNNEEHDRHLHKVLQRLEEKNLTLNPQKCQFRMDKVVVFMGLLVSKGSKPSARIEGWVLRLQPYSYKVCCVASRENIADALSRLTTLQASEKCRYDDEHVRMVALKAVPVAIKIQEIESASAEDEELQAVRNCLVSGNWEKGPRSFMMVRKELTFIGQVILRGRRIVIPKVLRLRVLELAHEGHQGIVKMKERLRSKVWWPGVDKAVERKCGNVKGANLSQRRQLLRV
ncbi:uncharacterized protein K02A2.6-like [Stylophora pistillata]|uniref:uncharacterized protein K02A2.6-like n=1 Tax=Stylophora pistillata TaxID=50429 RepID=UPI000C0464AE|nr:uncharacterized protein K02A2.6-like [Stylophora pistillata]